MSKKREKKKRENIKKRDFEEVSIGGVDAGILGCVSTNAGEKRKMKRVQTRDFGGSQHRRR